MENIFGGIINLTQTQYQTVVTNQGATINNVWVPYDPQRFVYVITDVDERPKMLEINDQSVGTMNIFKGYVYLSDNLYNTLKIQGSITYELNGKSVSLQYSPNDTIYVPISELPSNLLNDINANTQSINDLILGQSAQDTLINNKIDKVQDATQNDFASLNSNGTLSDSGYNQNSFILSSERQNLQTKIDNSNKLSSDLVDDTTATNKFVSSTDITNWNGKQDALDQTQLYAVNSGITSSLVTQIGTNQSDISTINGKIMSGTNNTDNQLANVNFVNSTVGTNTSNFIGTFSTQNRWDELKFVGELKLGSLIGIGSLIKAGSIINNTTYDSDAIVSDNSILINDYTNLSPNSILINGSNIAIYSVINHKYYTLPEVIVSDITIQNLPTNNDYAYIINTEFDFIDITAMNSYDKTQLTNFDYGWIPNGSNFDLYRFDIETQTWDLRVTNTSKASVTLNNAYNRYKYNANTDIWNYEYTLNNSSFTAQQWAAINSGINSNDVTKLSGIESGAQVNTVNSVNSKTGTIVLDADDISDTNTTNKFVSSTDITNWNGKQNALTAGSNITINGNTISATDTTYSVANSSTLGLVKLGSDTVQSVNAESPSSTANRTYPIQLNNSNQAVVNIPWTDTTYSSLSALSGSSTVSLVTRGEKYTWNNKANKTSSNDYTLYSSNWNNDTYTLYISGKTANNNALVSIWQGNSNTPIQDLIDNETAVNNAKLFVTENGSNLIFRCGTTPTTDLKIHVEVYD